MSKHTKGPWKAGRADMATLVDGVDSKWVYAGDHADKVAVQILKIKEVEG